MNDFNPLVPRGVELFIGLVLLLMLLGFCTFVYLLVRNRRVLQAQGIDPFTAQAQLADKLLNSEVLAPHKSLEERLRELDDLHNRGVISDTEHATARAAALAAG